MVQIVQQPPGLAELLGGGLGQGIQLGLQQQLQNLAQQRSQKEAAQAQQQQLQQTASGLQALGFGAEEASQLAGLSPQILGQLVKARETAPQRESYANALSQILGGPSEAVGEPVIPTKTNDQEISEYQRQSVEDTTQLLKQLDPKQATDLANLYFKKEKSQQRAQEKRSELSEKKQAKIDKETLPVFEKINKQAAGARDNINRLNRMKELINKGELPPAVLESAFANFPLIGSIWKAVTSKDAQEFRKLSKDFIANIKDVFPGRILQSEINAFLQTIPTLSQTDEGKAAVINNLMRFNEAALIKENAMEEIIENNNDIRPRNLDALVRKKVKPQLDELYKEFKEDGKKYFRPAYKDRFTQKAEKEVLPKLRTQVMGDLRKELGDTPLGRETERILKALNSNSL